MGLVWKPCNNAWRKCVLIGPNCLAWAHIASCEHCVSEKVSHTPQTKTSPTNPAFTTGSPCCVRRSQCSWHHLCMRNAGSPVFSCWPHRIKRGQVPIFTWCGDKWALPPRSQHSAFWRWQTPRWAHTPVGFCSLGVQHNKRVTDKMSVPDTFVTTMSSEKLTKTIYFWKLFSI